MSMYFQSATPLLSLVATASAFSVPRNKAIQWGPCPPLANSTPVECSQLLVPLDYTNTSSQTTLQLDLIRVPSPTQPSKGSILFNFGGPGGDGYENLAVLGEMLLNITGGYHDLVSFNPRGTGNTLTYSCYKNQSERALAQISNPGRLKTSSNTALGRLWAESTILAETCYAKLSEIGDLVGTAFVARDMMQIVDALGEDGFLRYWGFSYGTALGAVVASMFPDRMESVILDGVLNPQEYFYGYEVARYTDSDKTLRGFLAECAASPEACALGHRSSSAKGLETALWDLLETIKYHPFPVGDSVIDYTIVKIYIFSNLYYPSKWPELALFLDALLDMNATAIAKLLPNVTGSASLPNEANAGISCSDKSARAKSLSDMLQAPAWRELAKTTRWFPDPSWRVGAQCSQWRFEAKGRYEGDFCADTRKPVLLIGNTYDPTTSIVSAFNVSAGLRGSVVLRHDGYGHQSWVQRSACTDRHIRDYLVDGILPQPGSVCEPNAPVF